MSPPEEPKVQLANAYLLLPQIQSIQASHTLVQYAFRGEKPKSVKPQKIFDLRL